MPAKHAASAELRLARSFGVSGGFFLGLEADYELMQRQRQIDGKLATIQGRPCLARIRQPPSYYYYTQ